MYRPILTNKEYQRLSDEYDKVKIKCKYCGHKSVVPVWVDKRPCGWCGNNIYRNKQMEFTDTMKKLMKVR